MAGEGKISFWAAVLISINIIVGAGIFTAPQLMTRYAGSMSFLTWPLLGLLMFPVIWGIAQASRLFPGEGGFYNYSSKGIHPTVGLIAQWCYLIGYMGTAATIITFLRIALVDRIGWFFVADFPLLTNLVIILFFTLLNLLSINVISKIQSMVTLIKLLPLFFVIAICAWYWNPSIQYNIADLAGLGFTIPAAIFAYWGFETCCSLGHMIEGGTKQVGKVILTAFFIAAGIYMLFHFGLIQIMGVEALAAYGVLAFPLYMGLSPQMASFVSIVIVGSILLSFCNTIFGVSLTNITNIFVFARQKLVAGDRLLVKTNRWQRPTFVAFVHAAALWIFLWLVTNSAILTSLTGMGVTLAFVFTLVAVFLAYRRKKDRMKACFAFLGLLSCAILLYFCWMGAGQDTMARALNLSVLVAGVFIGYLLYIIRRVRSGAR